MVNDLTLEKWSAMAEILTHKDHEISFFRSTNWEDKNKPVLLLLHGFPTASYDWTRIWDELSTRFRLLAADMIGFGWSAKPAGYAYSILDQADLQEALLREHEVTAFHILAHDYGDTVAQELLARFAEAGKVADADLLSICFLNGGLFPETHFPTGTQKLLHGPFGPLVSRLLNRQRFCRGFSEIFGTNTKPTPTELDEFWALAEARGGIRPIAHKLLRYIDERKTHRARWVGALQSSPVPLQLINGPDDPVSGAHMVARYRELVPDPDVTILERIGHYPQWEAPQGVLSAFFGFHDRHEQNNRFRSK